MRFEIKRTNPFFIVMIIILIMLVVGTSGYFIYNKFIANSNYENNKINTIEEWVYVKETKTTKDNYICGQKAAETMLPQINLRNPYAQEYNKMLEDIYANTEQSNEYIGKYSANLNSNILSFVLYKYYNYCHGTYEIDAINFNVKSNKKIATDDIIKFKKMSFDTFKKKLNEALEDYYREKNNNDDSSYTKSDLKETKKNIDYNKVPTFLDEFNNVSAIVKVFCQNCMDTWTQDIIKLS